MQLDAAQRKVVCQVVRQWLGPDVRIFELAARVDDSRDVDMDFVIEINRPATRRDYAKIVINLEDALGIAVDIFFRFADQPPSEYEQAALAAATELKEA